MREPARTLAACILAGLVGSCGASPLSPGEVTRSVDGSAGALDAGATTLDAALVTGLHVSTTSAFPNNPRPTDVDVTLTDPAPARTIYEATLALPPFPPGFYNCPNDPGYRHPMSFTDGTTVVLTAELNPGGCRELMISGSQTARSTSDAYWTLLAQNLGVDESALFSVMQAAPPP